eukprot:TRINITY_DN2279_c0_g2_i1.p1 TRINITY_DN2279_c0_g2~~TRINITY_DN2279_c0_g2_i1.p1  ORF type:complete len:167 (-),score=31.56 TRINITY_DN2279_c0_g2_i1:37-537(-)
MQTVIVSHMEEVTSTINELGITDGDEDKANLEKVIRESTMEALTEMKPMQIPTSEDQEKVDSPLAIEKAIPQIEKEYQDKIEKLEQENRELNATLSRAGRDKLMAMSRLNSEMDKLRSHVRTLKASHDILKASARLRGRGGDSREWQDSQPRSPTSSITIWSWANV